MAADEVFAASAVARRALADDLEGLDPAQWATPSLCAGWDVRTVTAHLVSALSPAPLALLGALVRSGGHLHRANDVAARRAAARPTAELAAELRQRADSRASPPVTGPRGPLTDVLVHSGDIRLPLGLAHAPAPGAVALALDFVVTGRPVGFVPRGRLLGVRLVADDLGTAWGDGALVAGRGADLLLAACGRTTVLDSLRGRGVAVLRRRLGLPA